MNNFKKLHVPSVCITFTLVILSSCLWNVILENSENSYITYVFQVFAYLVIMRVVGVFIGKINFKKYSFYFITEMLIYYVVMLIFAYFGNWFGFRMENLLWVTGCFWAIGAYVHYHFYSIQRAEAEEINRLLSIKR